MNVTRAGFAEKSPLSINYEESVLYCIRLCVIWPCLIWHFSSAAFGFAASYFVSNTYWQLVPQHIISANVNRGTAAGINAIRRLKVKRCGELALRLSSHLTFAYVCVAIRAIHSSRCISAGPLVYFIQARNFSVAVRANLRFARSGRISVCLIIQRMAAEALLCHDSTAAGINAIRRLKVKRCGELALRLSSHLTFAYVCVAIRAIHSSRCISAGPLVYFIQARNFSVVVRAKHLTVNMPLRILVGVHRVFPLTINGSGGKPCV